MPRTAEIRRDTAETKIHLTLDLDGSGKSDVATGVGFLDHMLTLFARHGLLDLMVRCDGDLFLALTEQPGIEAAAYLARAKWVTVTEPARHARDWHAASLRRAYELIAGKLSKKRRRELGLAV